MKDNKETKNVNSEAGIFPVEKRGKIIDTTEATNLRQSLVGSSPRAMGKKRIKEGE